MLLYKDASFVVSITNFWSVSHYKLDAHSDYKYDRVHISDFIENLNGPLETLRK